MGVFGLHTFMHHNCPGAIKLVDIRQLADNYRRTHTGEKDNAPCIAVDTLSCLQHLYGELDWICGGQMKEFAQQLQAFVDCFNEIGVGLVFFFDGMKQESTKETRGDRSCHYMKVVDKMFVSLYRGEHPKGQMRSIWPVNLPNTCRYILCDIGRAEGSAVRVSFADTDADVAMFARHPDNRCLGVFSQDSDFIVLDCGAALALRFDSLNRQTMTANSFERVALCEYLQLDPNLLPLLVTLNGNDYVKRNDRVMDFHEQLWDEENGRAGIGEEWRTVGRSGSGGTGGGQESRGTGRGRSGGTMRVLQDGGYGRHREYSFPIEELVETIARYVKQFRCVDSATLITVAKKVFGDANEADLLRRSCDSYDTSDYLQKGVKDSTVEEEVLCDSDTPTWNTAVELALLRIESRDASRFCYKTMTSRSCVVGSGFDHWKSVHDFPPTSILFRSLRQHAYWVLLSEAPPASANDQDDEAEKLSSASAPSDDASGGMAALNLDDNRGQQTVRVAEWCAQLKWIRSERYTDKGQREPELIAPVPIPGVVHPGVLNLWTVDTAEVIGIRWQMLCGALGMNAQQSEIMMKMEPALVLSAAVLFYLQNPRGGVGEGKAKHPLLYEQEVDSILAMLYCGMNDEKVDPPTRPDVRMVQVANIFMNGLGAIASLNEAVGYPISEQYTKVWLLFDGFALQHFITREKNRAPLTSSDGTDIKTTSMFKQLKSIVPCYKAKGLAKSF